MKRRHPPNSPAATRIAQIAIAQFLLVEATLESLAALGDTVSRLRQHKPGTELKTEELTEPFRVRYTVFRQMLDEDRVH